MSGWVGIEDCIVVDAIVRRWWRGVRMVGAWRCVMVWGRWEGDLIIFSECSRMRHGGTSGRNIDLVVYL